MNILTIRDQEAFCFGAEINAEAEFNALKKVIKGIPP
jgi:hypothetical protein